jgi:hypothetical protein
MRKFGEIVGVVLDKSTPNQIMGKLQDRAKPCIYLGHAESHGKDVCRFLNLKTNKVIMSRNVVWMNKEYGLWKNKDQARFEVEDSNEDSDNELSTGLAVLFQDENEVETAVENNNTIDEDNSSATNLENDFTVSPIA